MWLAPTASGRRAAASRITPDFSRRRIRSAQGVLMTRLTRRDGSDDRQAGVGPHILEDLLMMRVHCGAAGDWPVSDLTLAGYIL